MCDEYNKTKASEVSKAKKILRRAKISALENYTPRRIISKRIVSTTQGPKIKITGIGTYEIIM